MRRFELSDEQWQRVKSLLPGQPGSPGRSAGNNRLFLDAVLWTLRTGAPWRDLPEQFGLWNTTFQRFNRWAKKGVWQRVFDALQEPDLEWVMLDATIIRAHVHAAGAQKKRRPGAWTLTRWIWNQDSCGLRRPGQPGEIPADARPDTRHHSGGTVAGGTRSGICDRRQGLRDRKSVV